MTQLEQLKILNDSTILYLKKTEKNYDKNSIIKSILDDDACFFKMNKDDAFQVLKDVGIMNKELENVYKELISRKEFYRLLKYKKIDIEDKDVIIKYPLYDNAFNNLQGNTEHEKEIKQDLPIAQSKASFFQKIKDMIKKIF